MNGIRSRITAWIGRRYLARAQKKGGLDLGKMSFLPDAALVPLKRDGMDPVPPLGELRRTEPISKLPLPFGPTVWLVTGYDEARAVLGRSTGFSNDFTNLVGTAGVTADENPGGLGFSDPPVHTRLRKLLTPEFTMRRLNRLVPRIQTLIDERLDEMSAAAENGPVDIVPSFAMSIPSLAICELLGVPYEEREVFQKLSTSRFDLFGGATASLGAINETMDYLAGVVERQRRDPGDDLLGMLVKEHGDEVTDRELAELGDGLLTGGYETTASMLALGTLVLLRDRTAFELVRDDDDAVPGVVEELLRYLTVVQVTFPRFAKEDMEFDGVRISTGDVVLVSLSGADRDERLGAGVDGFDPTRKPTSHLAFGHGIHRCVGAELARMELRLAYPALVRRFPDMRLAAAESELTFRKLSIVYGMDSLPVHLR